MDVGTFTWISSAATHIGKVRKLNEDAFLDEGAKGLWAVADGMGGHHAGDVASRLVVEQLSQVTCEGGLKDRADACVRHLNRANSELYAAGRGDSSRMMGSTVVVMLADAAQVAVLWAGDSRLYRLRGGTLEQVTRDHSQVEAMVSAGLLEPEQAANHPQANAITRAVGVAPELELDSVWLDADDDDTYLLCSDGLSHYLDERTLRALLGGGVPQEVAKALLDTALTHPARDNITCVVVHAHASGTATRTRLNPVHLAVNDVDDDPTVLNDS